MNEAKRRKMGSREMLMNMITEMGNRGIDLLYMDTVRMSPYNREFTRWVLCGAIELQQVGEHIEYDLSVLLDDYGRMKFYKIDDLESANCRLDNEENLFFEVQAPSVAEPVVDESQIDPFAEPVVDESQIDPFADPVVDESQIDPFADPVVDESQIDPFAAPVVKERMFDILSQMIKPGGIVFNSSRPIPGETEDTMKEMFGIKIDESVIDACNYYKIKPSKIIDTMKVKYGIKILSLTYADEYLALADGFTINADVESNDERYYSESGVGLMEFYINKSAECCAGIPLCNDWFIGWESLG